MERFLEFHLGDESYAVGLLQIREVITPPEITPIPKTPPHVCGLINLRGTVLTVIDLRTRLGIRPGENASQNAVIILDLPERQVGVVVDSIQKVLNIEEKFIKPVPDADGTGISHILGILHHEEKLTMWLDPNSLLDGTMNYKAA